MGFLDRCRTTDCSVPECLRTQVSSIRQRADCTILPVSLLDTLLKANSSPAYFHANIFH